MGSKPSPDGSRIALFACNRGKNNDGKGETLNLYLLDRKGNIEKEIKTSLLPYYSENLLSPIPVHFDWLEDNNNIILEAWNQEKYTSDIYRLETSTEKTDRLSTNARRPVVSPDGKKIAVLGVYGPGKHASINNITILDKQGNKVHTLTTADLKIDFFSHKQVIWHTDSNKLVAEAYDDKNNKREKVIVLWDLSTGESQKVNIEDEGMPLYISDDGGKIVYVTGWIGG